MPCDPHALLRGRVLDYTPDNRLKEIEGVAVYSYNGLGQRTRKHRLNENQSIAYLYDQAGQLRVKRTDAGVIQREYVYLNGRPLAVIIADHDGDGVPDSQDNCVYHANPDQYDSNGDGYGNRCDADLNNDGAVNFADLAILKANFFTAYPDADFNYDHAVNFADLAILKSMFFEGPGPSGETDSISPERIYYIHNDHLGTPKALTDEGGTKVWSATHTPFGQATVNEDPDGDGRVVVFNLRFPGQYYDRETGLHYNYFRYYDPEMGRYVSSDPIGLDGGLNTYAYALGNPIAWSDRLGLIIPSNTTGIPSGLPNSGVPDRRPTQGWDFYNRDLNSVYFEGIGIESIREGCETYRQCVVRCAAKIVGFGIAEAGLQRKVTSIAKLAAKKLIVNGIVGYGWYSNARDVGRGIDCFYSCQ